MLDEEVLKQINQRYPDAWLRGPRIARLGEFKVASFRLNADTAVFLGKQNIGIFIGGCFHWIETISRLKALTTMGPGSRWIFVTPTERMAGLIMRIFDNNVYDNQMDYPSPKLPATQGNIVFTTPESLSAIEDGDRHDVSSIIIFDLMFNIHHARGTRKKRFRHSVDRPQLLVNFRNELAIHTWLPPIILLTHKPARALTTDNALRAYCLDAWWFVDGRELKCGKFSQF